MCWPLVSSSHIQPHGTHRTALVEYPSIFKPSLSQPIRLVISDTHLRTVRIVINGFSATKMKTASSSRTHACLPNSMALHPNSLCMKGDFLDENPVLGMQGNVMYQRSRTILVKLVCTVQWFFKWDLFRVRCLLHIFFTKSFESVHYLFCVLNWAWSHWTNYR